MSKVGKKRRNKKQSKKKIKGNLDKKLYKRVEKELDNAFQFDNLEKLRKSYNLRDKRGDVRGITVAEFRAMDMPLLIPGLDRLVERYGEENILINDKVYEPMIQNIEDIDVQVIEDALVDLRLLTNAIVINSKKSKQIEAYRKAEHDAVKGSKVVIRKFKKIANKKSSKSTSASTGNKLKRVGEI